MYRFTDLPGAEPGSSNEVAEDKLEAMLRDLRSDPEEASETKLAFSDLTDESALEVLGQTFGPAIDSFTSSALDSIESAEEIVSYRGSGIAVIDPAGAEERAMIVSPFPLVDGQGEGIDLSLAERPNRVAVDNPVAPVSLPAWSDDPLRFQGSGVTLTLETGNVSEVEAELLDRDGDDGNQIVTYPNAIEDTDYVVAPTPTGAESFAQLRSENSSETLGFQLAVPSGATVESDESGGLEVVSGEGKTILSILKPFALDADGRNVPTTMTYSNGKLTIDVPHKDLGFAYPILVDPEMIYELYDHYWPSSNTFYNWSWYENAAGSQYYGSTLCPPALYPNDPCGGSGQGLFAIAPANRTYAAGGDSRYFWTPPGQTTHIRHAWIDSYEFRKGPNANLLQPKGYFGIASGFLWNERVVLTQNQGGSGMQLNGGTSARQLAVGLENPSAATLPSGWQYTRYNRLAYFTVELGDGEDPWLWPPSGPAGWIGNGTSPITIQALAGDPGMGIRRIRTTSPHRNPNQQHYLTITQQGCGGGPGSRCPEQHTFPVQLDPTQMPEGVNTVHFQAWDAMDKPSVVRAVPVRIDRTKPELRLSGSLVEASQANVPLIESSYELTIKADDRPNPQLATNLFSNMQTTVLIVDGIIEESKTYPECTSTISCATTHTITFEPDDFDDGDHSISVLGGDRAGNVQLAAINVEIDRVDNVTHVEVFDGDPRTTGERVAEEWKLVRGEHGRTLEADGTLNTRRVYRCVEALDPQGYCTETRTLTANTGSPEANSAEVRTSINGNDPRLSYQGYITPMPTGTPTATGSHSSVLPGWTWLPPWAGTQFKMFETTEPFQLTQLNDEPETVNLVKRDYYDATTQLPTLTRALVNGTVVEEVYYKYGANLNRAQLAQDFFGPAVPSSAENQSEVIMRDDSWEGNVVDEATGEPFTPIFLGVQFWRNGKLYCIKDQAEIQYSESQELNDEWEPDPALSAEDNLEAAPQVFATQESQFTATYFEAGPNGCEQEPPNASVALQVRSFASQSGAAQEWETTYLEELMTSEWEEDVLPLEEGILPPATQEEISLDGSVTDAYLVPVGAETVSVLAENADTQVQVMGNVELFTENPPDPDPEAPLIDADGYDLDAFFDHTEQR